jgi:hypothetical protein
VLRAEAIGLYPATSAMTVNLRRVAASAADAADSLRLRVFYSTEVGDSLASSLLGGSITNPTNRSFLVTDVILTCDGYANCFNSDPSTQTGSDSAFTDCDAATGGVQAWTRLASNLVALCDVADFTLGAYEVRQFVVAFNVPAPAVSVATISLTAVLGNGDVAQVSPPWNVRHSSTTTPGALTVLARSGGDDVAALGSSAPLVDERQTFTFRATNRGATSTPTRYFIEFTVPAGWSNLNATAGSTTTSVAIRQPTETEPGFVQFAQTGTFTAGATRDYDLTVTPSAGASDGALQTITVRTDATASTQHFNSNYGFTLRFT